MEVREPAGEMTVLQTLPAYYIYLKDRGYSKYTPSDFVGDVRKFGVFVKEKPIKEISVKDIQGWRSFLRTPSPKGEGLKAKTVSRKLTALSNFYTWLTDCGAVPADANPMLDIANSKVLSPLPEILFEEECGRLLATASGDPRTYLMVLLFLETGLKFEEFCNLKVSHFDFSNKYSPEIFVKHTWRSAKNDRKLKFPMEITTVFRDYVERYGVDDVLYPYTQRFIQLLITETAEKAGIKKKVSAQILRDTCAVRQIKRGQGIEKVLLRLGLSETTWEDAKVKYLKLAREGI
jgi:site-specific recombinase XerD